MSTQLQTRKQDTMPHVRRIENIISHSVLEDEERKFALSELLANMMHYCNEHQFNFWELEDKAHEWYRRER